MDRHHRILLDVWREACRHIEISEATDLITPLVAPELPLDVLLLRVVDLERSAVDTMAATVRNRSPVALRIAHRMRRCRNRSPAAVVSSWPNCAR